MNLLFMALIASPITLTGAQRFWMLLPLCLSISIVYKTVRCHNLRDVPLAALALWGTVVAGMIGVGVGLWLLFLVMA